MDHHGVIRQLTDNILYGEFGTEADANEYAYVKMMSGWQLLSPVFRKEPYYESWDVEDAGYVVVMYKGERPT